MPVIMKSAHQNFDALSVASSNDPVDKAMLARDPSRPPAAQIPLQRLRLADPRKSAPADISNQCIDAAKSRSIGFLPMEIVFPPFCRPEQFHSSSISARRVDRLPPAPLISTGARHSPDCSA